MGVEWLSGEDLLVLAAVSDSISDFEKKCVNIVE